jgi:hypothetical protein
MLADQNDISDTMNAYPAYWGRFQLPGEIACNSTRLLAGLLGLPHQPVAPADIREVRIHSFLGRHSTTRRNATNRHAAGSLPISGFVTRYLTV